MKAFFTILKFALLAALLIGLSFGYIFFRVWQKNERPTIESNSWDKEQILLGHDATLRVSITAPWHREIIRPTPFAHPEFLAPVPGEATIKKGSLNLKGKRTWELRVPFVATDTKSLKGLTATFPLKTPKRISPNSVTLTLPPLSIVTPDETPKRFSLRKNRRKVRKKRPKQSDRIGALPRFSSFPPSSIFFGEPAF
jgi:hypothetical protein